MPRPKLETAYIGRYTMAALDAAPDSAFLWLGRALFAWILRDELPKEVPPEHLAAWTMIRTESEMIHDSMKESIDARSEAGRIGAAARWKMRNDAIACDRIQSHAVASNRIESQCDAMRLMRESESESENNSASLRDASIPRPPAPAHACEETPCPLDEDTIRVTSEHIGMPQAEVDAWRDYYSMRDWRADPRSPRPMNKGAALASLRRWHTNEGIRVARQEHIDAKMDERHQQTLASRAANTATFVESEEAARRRKEQEAADLAKAKQLMNW